jgi:hypothetical protein
MLIDLLSFRVFFFVDEFQLMIVLYSFRNTELMKQRLLQEKFGWKQ